MAQNRATTLSLRAQHLLELGDDADKEYLEALRGTAREVMEREFSEIRLGLRDGTIGRTAVNLFFSFFPDGSNMGDAREYAKEGLRQHKEYLEQTRKRLDEALDKLEVLPAHHIVIALGQLQHGLDACMLYILERRRVIGRTKPD